MPSPYLTLIRPANVVTAIVDILTGIAIAGCVVANGWFFEIENGLSVLLLCIASACLYAGGVAFNDVFDAELDAKERPERPIPSGKISRIHATLFASSLLVIGVIISFLVSLQSGYVATAISLLALLYDYKSKHFSLWGPLNMSLCRVFNLFLGLSISTVGIETFYFLGIVPLINISALTLISRGEVNGGKVFNLFIGGFLYSLVLIFLLTISYISGFKILNAFPFIVYWLISVYYPLMEAIKSKANPHKIMLSVKAGVISTIILNAGIAAGFSNFLYGIILLILLFVSLYLAKKFAVS